MRTPPRFDEIIHARNRLKICSKHLKILVDAGFVHTTKEKERGRGQPHHPTLPRTQCSALGACRSPVGDTGGTPTVVSRRSQP